MKKLLTELDKGEKGRIAEISSGIESKIIEMVSRDIFIWYDE